jgi:hypothetical protein
MRLWSIHPKYLDARGLVALWREGLLAQKVLQGQTRGYKHHPQLRRFAEAGHPLGAIACYLREVWAVGHQRGYRFDRKKIVGEDFDGHIPVARGQLEYEFEHLLGKLKTRDPERYLQLKPLRRIEPHPLFAKVHGGVETWEVLPPVP